MALSAARSAQGDQERELLERARAGDREALDALIRLHLDDVYRLAYRLLGNRERAEDATQDTFVNVLQALPRFRGESSFRTWLLRIAANAARSHGRRWGRRRETELNESELGLADQPDAVRNLEQREAARRVEEALTQLPPKQRLAVAMRIQQGLSYREIAELGGGSEGAARVNYHLGIKRLRELLQ